MNLEYRWEAFSGLDMAIFGDAGKVASRRRDVNLKDLESDVGFGFRFNTIKSVFLRIDVGFSHEGARVFSNSSRHFEQGGTRVKPKRERQVRSRRASKHEKLAPKLHIDTVGTQALRSGTSRKFFPTSYPPLPR
jgi:hypothetical protein